MQITYFHILSLSLVIQQWFLPNFALSFSISYWDLIKFPYFPYKQYNILKKVWTSWALACVVALNFDSQFNS
jgi:hypothetical protein